MCQPIYDRYGRMQYHPELHPNHKKPWTTHEERYLVDYYEKVGPDQLSAELGRTIHTIMQRATHLRKSGVLHDKRRYHHRLH